MKVKVRLKRLGKKKVPFYRIVVASAVVTRDGQEIEKLGYYDPLLSKGCIRKDRLDKWVAHGAQINSSVEKLLKRDTLSYNS